jgi:hypothetical protein
LHLVGAAFQADDAAAIAAEVSALRSLAEKSPLRIEVVDDAALAKAVQGKVRQEVKSNNLEREAAMWIVFGFA